MLYLFVEKKLETNLFGSSIAFFSNINDDSYIFPMLSAVY